MAEASKQKTKYKKIAALKKEMSQMYDDSSNVVPFTELVLKDIKDIKLFESVELNKRIKLIGKGKGKGYAGVIKRWGFAGGPSTHGQKDRQRSPGSIGSQGVSRVMPGKKMAGRLGGKNITIQTRLLSVDEETGVLNVKGGVPGSRNSIVYIYIENNED